ncbi:MAG: signal peptidase I [Thermoleophilia bacterium]|nr:signal peptidase I [Thermoleophilia bacterium]
MVSTDGPNLNDSENLPVGGDGSVKTGVPTSLREGSGGAAAQGLEGAQAVPRKRSGLGLLLEIIFIVVAAFAIAMLVQAFVVKPFTIHQISMQPTLLEGDRILLSRLTYHFREPKPGDIIVFHSPVVEGEDLVKRIVAVEGDRVAIKDGVLYVNGVARDEPYLFERPFRGDMAELTVPEGKVFVLGDNRNNSGDSRFFGPIDKDLIIGCALCVYWPIGRWKGL